MGKNNDIMEVKEGFRGNESNIRKEMRNGRRKMRGLEVKRFQEVRRVIEMEDREFKEYEIRVRDFMK